MAAATANGTLTPPPTSDLTANHVADASSSNKRKRDEEPADDTISRHARLQRDLLDLLLPHDTEPSFLQHPLTDTGRALSTEPSHKKPKLADTSSNDTIASRLGTGTYKSIVELKDDASQIGQALTASLRSSPEDEARVPVDRLKQVQRVKAYEQLLKDVADRESSYEAAHEDHHTEIKRYGSTLPNGHAPRLQGAHEAKNSTVLTLFGNAPTPKQLFSSLQHVPANPRDALIKTELPVEEMSLPNGLSATNVVAVPRNNLKSGPTFAESFAPPTTLPLMQPPKPHKRATTRENGIAWEFKEPLSRNSKRGGYTTQALSTSEWLNYGGVDTTDDPASPGQRRKKRDRALSGTAIEDSPVKQSVQDALEKEEEALFRRAYSTFAPSCDNTRALVPDEIKSMVWWQKIGNKRYNEIFAVDPELMDEPVFQREDSPSPSAGEDPIDDNEISRAMEELETSESVLVEAAQRSSVNVDEVLQRISELLETLATHQRIRNATLPSSTAVRTPASPALASAEIIVGKPDTPAVYEKDTYNSLTRELAYLVMKLPPYAVAKLDGDQLADLGVSRLITIDDGDVKGTMEEDQVSRQAKYAALTAASGMATLQRSSSASNPHYSSSNQRAPAIGQAANTRYGQAAQYGSRTPAPAYQRSGSSQTAYGTPSATASRPGFSQPGHYSRQSSYGQPNGQYYQQRSQQTPVSYGGYTQQYQHTPVGSGRNSFSQQVPQYQQRSQSAAANAVSYQNNPTYQAQQAPNYGRTISPVKPASYSSAPQNAAAPAARPNYATQQYPGQPYTPQQQPQQQQQQQQQAQPPPPQAGSERATPGYTSNPQTPVNGFPSRPPPPPVVPRAASGTPQPPQAAAVPSPSAHGQSQGQGQVNGHALNGPSPAMHGSTGMYNTFNHDNSPKQKRNRRPVACDSCRLRKHKCVILGDVPPCQNCEMNARSCTFGESTDVLRASTGGGNIGADGKKKLRCDLCKEKKMACSYEHDPPCVACKMRGVECTFDVAEAKLLRQSGGIGPVGGMRIPDGELPYKPENMQVGMSDGLD